MSEEKYRWPEIRKKWTKLLHVPENQDEQSALDALLVTEQMFIELLGLKQGFDFFDVEDLIDRMKAALEREERRADRQVPMDLKVIPDDPADAEKAAMAEKVLGYYGTSPFVSDGTIEDQAGFNKMASKRLEDDPLDKAMCAPVEGLKEHLLKGECSCGGPPGHVPGGVRCRK